ncbi:unnamed protein product [Closterium sp. NIES-54]
MEVDEEEGDREGAEGRVGGGGKGGGVWGREQGEQGGQGQEEGHEEELLQYPVAEMACDSKLSCVSWNPFVKSLVASSNYDGAVQVWDVCAGEAIAEYREHERRVWSVHCAPTDPTKLASGSDDGCVRIWSLQQDSSVATIRTRANVCAVHFSPASSHILALGSADFKLALYDLRKLRSPLATLPGHSRAVSYVAFADPLTLVSASTDNTLRVWDLREVLGSAGDGSVMGLQQQQQQRHPGQGSMAPCVLTLSGHVNEKNFVGLSVSESGYIACGSENNSAYVYHRSVPAPITCHRFGAVDAVTGRAGGEDAGHFVSSVCWRKGTHSLVAANSMGDVKVLEMVE